ncbi:MSCRAMM family protein [Carnobacterium divergens]|uniref:MSCRAMM family protein n=1 Tax=Carnobacterium divergens TaxID=2748 RepID=UPI002891DC51|nr:SpaA isopeptide-forming pilin-related protein [Carnobacterium divergens]MDT2012892.1 SpaA isopeptide-forming pilin-related protein [Carnobacterium divergens]
MINFKMKNKIATSILTLSLALGSFLPVASVSAKGEENFSATKHTISILEKDITYLKSEKDGSTPVRMVDRLRDENGMATFCINFDLPSPPGLEVEGFEQLDNATTYLMNAFYQGNPNLTGDKSVDEYIVQATIHNIKSLNSFSLDRPFIDEKGILPRIKALKEEALKAPAPSVPVYDNNLSVDKKDLTFKLVNGNYESNVVTATVKGDLQSSTVTIKNATPGTKLVNEEGKEVKTVANGSKVKVLVPEKELQGKALSPSVSLKGHFSNAYKVAVRFGGNEGYQDVASYESKEFAEDKEATINGKIDAAKGSVEFEKKGSDEKLLDNVKFNIIAADEKTVEKEVTTKDGKVHSDDLSYGVHYLVEVSTLPNYVLNSEKIPFTINHDKEVIDLGTIYNQLKKGKIIIHKVDKEGKPLENAEFTRMDENGETEVKTSDKDGLVEFDIEAGHVYSVEETKNPENYKGTFKEENISVEKDGQIFEYSVENQKIEKSEPLPQTGEPKLIIGVVGLTMIAAGCIGFVIWKKKLVK